MKNIKNYTTIYRVVDTEGPFVSVWVATRKEAEAILKKVSKDIIFGGDTYKIEKSTFSF